MKVLYLHPAGAFGGASKSLIELFGLLREAGVSGTVLTPGGSAAGAFAEAGMSVRTARGLSQFDNTSYGHYRRLRWLILLREFFFLPFSLLAVWRLRRERFDILHVNEITLLPLGIVAKRLLRLPMVVHVRSLQRAPGTGWRTRLVNRLLRKHADVVAAIDHTVANTLENNLPLTIVHNGLRVNELSGRHLPGRSQGGLVRVGFLGVLIALKGIYELVEAMRILKERGVPVECVVAGENARELSGIRAWALRTLGFARNVRVELEEQIEKYGLQQHIQLLGFVGDVHALYPRLDILCFPSHLNAAGRPVFEAAFYGVPSVVAVTDPLPDAVQHGVTGLAIPRSEPGLIADALQRLVEDEAYRLQLGSNARDWAVENFSIKSSASAMLKVYKRLGDRTVSV
ncbi:MAG: glycosyltransferase family 4 protein [Zoogloeaceae bacterium]|nr:glycosyltransferase family 4 protein [Zoogloeaceae bacterium]